MQSSESSIECSGQYLSFTLGGEAYAINIMRVREIREWEPLRSLPDTPAYIKGVLDLRGTMVPIIDLRQRFNLARIEYGPTTVIIILMVETGARQLLIGIVVDGVSEVLDTAAGEIRKVPDLGSAISTRYMTGMLPTDEGMVILLSIDRMLNPDELGACRI